MRGDGNLAGRLTVNRTPCPRLLVVQTHVDDRYSQVINDVAEDVGRRSTGVYEGIQRKLGTTWERITSVQETDDTNRSADVADPIEGEKE